MLLPNQEHPHRSDHESSGYESKASYLILLLISFLHQTTTVGFFVGIVSYCFLSHFYIKPQPVRIGIRGGIIASYLISTSNHNGFRVQYYGAVIASYLISTSNHNPPCSCGSWSPLLLISFLHQTTTRCTVPSLYINCFLSHFYIKPQLGECEGLGE